MINACLWVLIAARLHFSFMCLFYTGKMFPASHRGGIFSTQHGSWNRTEPVGARVMFTPVDKEGNVSGETVPFAEGWLDENGEYLGRPVDVAHQLRDGSLLISDDLAGAIVKTFPRWWTSA